MLNGIVLGTSVVPQGTVMLASGVIVGKAAGLTWIVLLTETKVLLQISFAVQVSVISPPQAPAGTCELKVDGSEVPDIRQGTAKLLE